MFLPILVYVKHVTHGPQWHNFHKLVRGLQGDAINQILRL